MKPVQNTQKSAVLLESMIIDVLKENHQFKYVVGINRIPWYPSS